jgi:hypothetical protein
MPPFRSTTKISLCPVRSETSAISFPSGDHSGVKSFASVVAIRFNSRVSIRQGYMFSLPERIESKAIVFPSGDQLLSSLMVPMSFLGSTVCAAMLFARMKSDAMMRYAVF